MIYLIKKILQLNLCFILCVLLIYIFLFNIYSSLKKYNYNNTFYESTYLDKSNSFKKIKFDVNNKALHNVMYSNIGLSNSDILGLIDNNLDNISRDILDKDKDVIRSDGYIFLYKYYKSITKYQLLNNQNVLESIFSSNVYKFVFIVVLIVIGLIFLVSYDFLFDAIKKIGFMFFITSSFMYFLIWVICKCLFSKNLAVKLLKCIFNSMLVVFKPTFLILSIFGFILIVTYYVLINKFRKYS